MRALSSLYFANAPIYHIMIMMISLLGKGMHSFTGLKGHPGQYRFKEQSITSGRRHASQVDGYIEKPAKVCQAVNCTYFTIRTTKTN